MCDVIDLAGEKVEIENSQVLQIALQLCFEFAREILVERRRAGANQAGKQGARGKMAFQSLLQRHPMDAALEKLKALIPLCGAEGIDQKGNTGAIEHFNAGHIHFMFPDIAEIKGEEIQIVIHLARIAVVFDISSDNGMASRIEDGPGGRRQANAARVEILKHDALLAEDMRQPGQLRFTGYRIDLLHCVM